MNSINTAFRFKKGQLEIELSGERDFVEQQIALWLPTLLSEGAEKPEMQGTETSEPPVMRVRRRIDLEDFVALKAPSNSIEQLLALAYYLEKYEGRPDYEAEDLRALWSQGAATATWDDELLDQCLSSGFLEAGPSGAFTLTFTGEQYVQGGF